jgi:hypothetical protein
LEAIAGWEGRQKKWQFFGFITEQKRKKTFYFKHLHPKNFTHGGTNLCGGSLCVIAIL